MTTQEMRIPELTLGWRLRMAREYAGIDQRVMADYLGVSQAAIAQWERDQRRPRDLLTVVRRWSEITSVPEWWLLGLNGSTTPSRWMETAFGSWLSSLTGLDLSDRDLELPVQAIALSPPLAS